MKAAYRGGCQACQNLPKGAIRHVESSTVIAFRQPEAIDDPLSELARKGARRMLDGKTVAVEYDPKDEIEEGISAVRWAVEGPTAPYFRFPALYLGKQSIGIFSADLDSFDFKMRKPEQATAEAAMDLLNDLKAGGYKVVFMKPKFAVTTIASYDGAIMKQVKAPVGDGRPTLSIVCTISE